MKKRVRFVLSILSSGAIPVLFAVRLHVHAESFKTGELLPTAPFFAQISLFFVVATYMASQRGPCACTHMHGILPSISNQQVNKPFKELRQQQGASHSCLL
jgi:hypothetical protein